MFEQRAFFTHRSLTLEPEGLRFTERKLNAYNELTISYEDLLPLGTARFRYVPVRFTVLSVFLAFGCGKVFYDYVLRGEQPNSAAWLLLILLGLLGVLVAYTAKQYHWHFVITTGKGNISFLDLGSSGKQLPAVVAQLQAYTVAHLRRKYLRVNAFEPAEAQLERLMWLRNNNVIKSTEYERYEQQLLGQRSQLIGSVGFSLN
ncbi:hypothetical protein [Solirubrum puertoriconensis]|uniref:Uncharacterized protein n=1 Tax=Solirubrum puertoriconensis TaxID=1751427 RepID=A0A9X0L6H3_SOLP1|nr:hypothetical protein [Solirubrum puertoriconensis]KUG09849.1 hypothetical protein ASU33_19470 [Solirubrum puertoriconensis]